MTSPRISKGKAFQIAWDVHDGKADPVEVKALMREFVTCVDDGDLSASLVRYVRDAFQTYLAGERTLDAAFGLTRGTPGTHGKPEELRKRAFAVLRTCLAGSTLVDAQSHVAETHHKSLKAVERAWKNYRHEALMLIHAERPETQPFTPKEMSRLHKLFRRTAEQQRLLDAIFRGQA